jgi:hypothetical protein
MILLPSNCRRANPRVAVPGNLNSRPRRENSRTIGPFFDHDASEAVEFGLVNPTVACPRSHRSDPFGMTGRRGSEGSRPLY